MAIQFVVRWFHWPASREGGDETKAASRQYHASVALGGATASDTGQFGKMDDVTCRRRAGSTAHRHPPQDRPTPQQGRPSPQPQAITTIITTGQHHRTPAPQDNVMSEQLTTMKALDQPREDVLTPTYILCRELWCILKVLSFRCFLILTFAQGVTLPPSPCFFSTTNRKFDIWIWHIKFGIAFLYQIQSVVEDSDPLWRDINYLALMWIFVKENKVESRWEVRCVLSFPKS